MLPDTSLHQLGHAATLRARGPRVLWRGLLHAFVLASALLCTAAALALSAGAVGNASSAAAFIESAQNRDGGFGAHHAESSNPGASLWATVALLAAGKSPQDERLNNAASADEYLAAHLPAYRSLSDLGLLALIQSAAALRPGRLGDPAAALSGSLTPAAVRGDPGGAALGILGLLAINSGSARQAATSAARALLASADSDGGWGYGLSDSASTALALQALAAGGVADPGTPAVARGIAYLKSAQVNDGSIAASNRTDPSSAGNVAATAFAIQAFRALRVPAPRTSTGTTVLDGLASYQQQGTGGLSQFGSYDTGVAPSVLDTAQAYPAFDGVTFPLPYVPYLPSIHPPAPRKVSATAPNRASVGTASAGISAATTSGGGTVGAFKGASAAGSTKSRTGKGAAGGGTSVTGAVVDASPSPKLTTGSGRPPAKDYTALLLTAGLLVFALLGAAVDSRRPRRNRRSAVAAAVGEVAAFLAAARARGAFAPFAALLVGLTLLAIPLHTRMWDRAPKGAAMITSFAPYMNPHRLATLQGDVGLLDAGVHGAVARGPSLQFPRLRSGAAARGRFLGSDPELALLAQQWPAIHRRFVGLLGPMQANRSNYDAIDALPSFRLFPWLFAIPGAIVVLLAATALLVPATWSRLRWGILAVGVALALAPLGFQMFDRAPKGERLIAAFRTIETRATLTAVQNDFASLTIGQEAVNSELIPALRQRGLAAAQISNALPSVTALSHSWVRILGDLTPLLGVMSDNIANYQAAAALPRFTLFPWLFIVPGLLALGLVLVAGMTRPWVLRHGAPAAEPQHAGEPQTT
jgi:hypothetical protein